MASLYERRLKSILRRFVTPVLKAAKYVKCGSTYIRRHTELAWVIDVERSVYNDGSRTEFTLSCGVYVPGFMSPYAGIGEPRIPKSALCCLHARLGMLSGAQVDTWWKLTASDTIDAENEIGLDIRRRLTENGLPFLERFHTCKDALDFLVEPRRPEDKHVWPQSDINRLTSAAILYYLQGDIAKSKEYFAAAAEAEIRSRLRSPVVPIIRARVFAV